MAERRSNLNQALAASAARWAVDQAIAAGATVIYWKTCGRWRSGGWVGR